jgi:hypothetical protein
MRRCLSILGACAALSLAGCGGDDAPDADPDEIGRVVERFALADGPRACRLLTPDALVRIYGRFRQPVREARESCERRASDFEGREVEITEVQVSDDVTATVRATGEGGEVTYAVKVLRIDGRWRIDRINQSRADES